MRVSLSFPFPWQMAVKLHFSQAKLQLCQSAVILKMPNVGACVPINGDCLVLAIHQRFNGHKIGPLLELPLLMIATMAFCNKVTNLVACRRRGHIVCYCQVYSRCGVMSVDYVHSQCFGGICCLQCCFSTANYGSVVFQMPDDDFIVFQKTQSVRVVQSLDGDVHVAISTNGEHPVVRESFHLSSTRNHGS